MPTPTPTRIQLVPNAAELDDAAPVALRTPPASDLRTLGSLSYPWEAQRNPAAERAEIAATSWVTRHGMLRDAATAARYRGVDVGLLSAMASPDRERT